LIEGSDGGLYGTTLDGGGLGNHWGVGTVFKLNRDGSAYTVLHFFTGGADGYGPYAGLMEGSDGGLYGTTFYGGSNTYLGTVFKLNRDGSDYTVLYRFKGGTDGYSPYAGLMEGSDGALYGTTSLGGSNYSWGTVFKLNRDGSAYTVLFSFPGGADGARPQAGLIEGTDGALYGTTSSGGSNDFGTVFRLNRDGSAYTVLHRFTGGADGAHPYAGLIGASDGALYGTTTNGGTNNAGTVFKLNRDGSGYTVLRSFTGGTDGAAPYAGLTQGQDGLLYGTTLGGGSNGYGTVFTLNKDGSGYRILFSFRGTADDGARPQAGLLKGSDGALYGSTLYGGDMNGGIVFKLFSSAPQVALTGISFGDLGAHLIFSGGAAGQAYKIQAITNLVMANGWQLIGSNTAAIDGRFQFLDIAASNYPARFYRSVTP